MKVRVRFGDTDPFGVTYFSSYFDYFKSALDEFLREKGISPESFYRNPDENYAFPIVFAEARFYRPTRFDDEIEVTVAVENVKENSVVFKFEARKSERVAEGKIVCACVDKEWRKRPVPEKLKRLLQS